MQSDLVGFREENVLQISGFYKADVQINYLAELITDKAVGVRESVVQMLREFMTEMGDRYDHQTRYSTCYFVCVLLFSNKNPTTHVCTPCVTLLSLLTFSCKVQYSSCYLVCALYSTALYFTLHYSLLCILLFSL